LLSVVGMCLELECFYLFNYLYDCRSLYLVYHTSFKSKKTKSDFQVYKELGDLVLLNKSNAGLALSLAATTAPATPIHSVQLVHCNLCFY
jgi:hypothetical protein